MDKVNRGKKLSRITLTIYPDEREAIAAIAQRERRDPRAQAAMLLRTYLQLLGEIKKDTTPEVKRETQPA